MFQLIKVIVIFFTLKLVFSLICQEIVELPEDRSLSLSELQSIPPKEVVDCLPHLGRKGMALDEAEYIWHTIVEFYEGVVNVPENVLSDLHYVSVAIPPEDYDNITMGNIDVISNFGLASDLSDVQLEAIAIRVREDFADKQPEDYTFYDLVALRQILCAFTRSEIERIHPKAYKEAATVIGKLKKCNRDVFQGFAQLAIKADGFGPLPTWTNATLQMVGAVADYLPNDAFNGLKVKFVRNVSMPEHA